MSGLSARAGALFASQRDRLNAAFALGGQGLERAWGLGLLRRMVAPALERLDDAAAEAVVIPLFELGLRGMRSGLVGREEASAFEVAVVGELHHFAGRLQSRPREVLRLLGNGYATVERELGEARACRWLVELAELAFDLKSFEALEGAGLVVAWKQGLAEARESALAAAGRLEPVLATRALGAPGIDPDPIKRFCRPGHQARLGPLALMGSAGGFLGFGGRFRRPPMLRLGVSGIECDDGSARFSLHADVYGARVVPVRGNVGCDSEAEAERVTLGSGGRVEWRGASVELRELASARQAVAHRGVVAVALDDSHLVYVLGFGEAG